MNNQPNSDKNEPYKPALSKRRKKNKLTDECDDSAVNLIKNRNRENAQLDRYKRRLIIQYLKCLPYLVAKNLQIFSSQKTDQCNQAVPDRSAKSNSEELIKQHQLRKQAMDIAINKFLQFHNLHIVEKDQFFTFESIKPEVRKHLFNFIENLKSYTCKQLFEMNEKKLLDHTNSDRQKEKQSQYMKQRAKKQKKLVEQGQKQQAREQKGEGFCQIKLQHFPLIIFPIEAALDNKLKDNNI